MKEEKPTLIGLLCYTTSRFFWFMIGMYAGYVLIVYG